MGKNVITIPATISRTTAVPLGEIRKRRVAAYARVSTDHEDPTKTKYPVTRHRLIITQDT